MNIKRFLKLHSLFVCICFLTLSLSCSSLAKGDDFSGLRKPVIISDVNTITSVKRNMNIKHYNSNITLDYSISYQVGKYGKPSRNTWSADNPGRITQAVSDSSANIIKFAALNGVAIKDCKGSSYNLNIFSLERGVMMQRNRFTSVINSDNLPTEVWGFYDPTDEHWNNSAILVSNINPAINNRTLHHEMAHYWWDRICIDKSWPGTTEDFAMAYETYYRNTR